MEAIEFTQAIEFEFTEAIEFEFTQAIELTDSTRSNGANGENGRRVFEPPLGLPLAPGPQGPAGGWE